ncbi:MAG: hypothetical protein HC898_11340 [Phycisphaerales bacterium]|nr:hypothetical protein [Phycisphaerales bacterium]
MNLLPFWYEFQHNYQSAVETILRTMLVYMMVGVLLLVQFFSVRRKRGLGMMLGGVLLLAMLLQAGRFTNGYAGFDVTEPLLALSAGAVLVLGLLALVRSVKAHCRRKSHIPVHIERRRIRHRYA